MDIRYSVGQACGIIATLCCLCLPLPFYKITEGYLGRPIMTEEQMRSVLEKMNKR